MKAIFLIFLSVGCAVLPGCDSVRTVKVADIKITFAKSFVPPSHELPDGALYPKGSGPDEQGAFTNIVAGRIAALNVTWMNSRRLKTEGETQDLLREILSSTNTQTWTYHIWSFGDVEPDIVATVAHVRGERGKWVMWCSPQPGLYWAYQDGSGKWWWGQWNVLNSNEPKPKSLGALTK